MEWNTLLCYFMKHGLQVRQLKCGVEITEFQMYEI